MTSSFHPLRFPDVKIPTDKQQQQQQQQQVVAKLLKSSIKCEPFEPIPFTDVRTPIIPATTTAAAAAAATLPVHAELSAPHRSVSCLSPTRKVLNFWLRAKNIRSRLHASMYTPVRSCVSSMSSKNKFYPLSVPPLSVFHPFPFPPTWFSGSADRMALFSGRSNQGRPSPKAMTKPFPSLSPSPCLLPFRPPLPPFFPVSLPLFLPLSGASIRICRWRQMRHCHFFLGGGGMNRKFNVKL